MKDMTEQIYDELNAQVVRMLNHSLAQASRIADLERQLSEHKAARIAYASEFQLDKNGDPDVGNIHANIRALKAQLAEASVPAVDQQPFGYVATLTSPGGTIFHWSRVVREKRDADACAKQWEANGKVGVAALYTAPQAADTDKVREAILKLPCLGTMSQFAKLDDLMLYQQGHEDALHEASELVGSMAPQAPVREVPETWVGIDDRLPNDDCRVLAATWFDMTQVQQVEVVSFRSGSGTFSDCNVTHWQPLPEPPSAPVQQEGNRG